MVKPITKEFVQADIRSSKDAFEKNGSLQCKSSCGKEKKGRKEKCEPEATEKKLR